VRILSIYINGFGLFHDVGISDISPGLTLFEGANEAGKSTLLAFLRAIPFGFEGRGDDPRRYPPLAGGTHGGHIEVEIRAGRRFRLQRLGDKPVRGVSEVVDLADGRILGGEEVVAQVLGHADGTLYREVFAFSLEQLQGDKPFHDKSVGGRLLSGALGAGAAHVLEAEQKLDNDLQQLYKRRGRKQRINRLLSGREEISNRLREIKKQAAGYAALRRQEEELERKVREDEHTRNEVDRRIAELKVIQQAWKPWAALDEARNELAQMEAIDEFPPDGLARLERLNEESDKLRRQIAEIEADIKRKCKERERLEVDERLLARRADINELGRQCGMLEQHIHDLPKREAELRAQEAGLARDLADLGLDWTEEELERRDLSRLVIQQCREHGDAIEQARTRLERARDEVKRQQEAVQNAASRVAEASAGKLPLWPGVVLGMFLVVIAALSWTRWPVVALCAAGALGAPFGWYILTRQMIHHSTWRAEQERKSVEMRLQEAEAEVQKASESLGKAQSAWREWLSKERLPEDLTPDTTQDLLSRAQRLRERLPNIRQLRERIKGMRRDLEAIQEKAASVFAGVGREAPELSSLPGAIRSLAEELDQSVTNDAARLSVDAALEELQEQFARRKRELQELQQQKETLLAQADAGDDEEFRRRAQIYQQRNALKEKIAAKKQELAVLTGGREASDRLEAQLANTDRSEFEIQLAELETKHKGLEEQIGKNREELGSIRKSIADLEKSDEASELLQRQMAIDEELRECVSEWCVLTTCRHLLDLTRRKWERERQPKEIKVAEAYIKRVTDGRYMRLYQPSGEEQVILETQEGKTLDPSRLSRGTREQLYLCLRFGHIEVYNENEQAEPLPIIMDDIIANFDPYRTQRTAEAIVELAQKNQVFFFTCHPETIEMFLEVAPVDRRRFVDGRIETVNP